MNYSNNYYKSIFKDFSITNKNTYTTNQRTTISDLILIEAKHEVNILKILHKLQKIYRIYNILKYLSHYGTNIDIETYHKNFREMYNKYIKGRNIDNVYIIFTSDIIDNDSASLIKYINTRIDETTYNNLLYNYFVSDARYTPLMKDKDLNYKLKLLIKNAKTYTELYDILRIHVADLKTYERFIYEYNLPYSYYMYDYFKGKVGYYDESTLYFERF